MTSTTTAQIYAHTQHKEYEAQAAQYAQSRNAQTAPAHGAKQEMIMAKIAKLLQQIREHPTSQIGEAIGASQ